MWAHAYDLSIQEVEAGGSVLRESLSYVANLRPASASWNSVSKQQFMLLPLKFNVCVEHFVLCYNLIVLWLSLLKASHDQGSHELCVVWLHIGEKSVRRHSCLNCGKYKHAFHLLRRWHCAGPPRSQLLGAPWSHQFWHL